MWGARRRSLFWVLLALGTALMLGALGHGFSTGVAIPPVPLRTDVSEPSTGTHHTTHADQPDSHQRHAAFAGAHLRLNLSDINPELIDAVRRRATEQNCLSVVPVYDSALTAALDNYTRYLREYCAVTGVLQMHIPFERYTAILDTIAVLVCLRPGMRVFDFGSGCGTMLNYFHKRFNTTGVGIDLTDDGGAICAFAQPAAADVLLDGWRASGVVPVGVV